MPLPTGRGYEPVAALKLGRSVDVVETPGGPITEPGCGCASVTPVSRTFTCSSLSGPYPVTDGSIFLDISGEWDITITYDDGVPPKPNEIPPPQNESGSGPTTIVLSVPAGAVQYTGTITCTGGQIIILGCGNSGSISSLPAAVSITVPIGTAWNLTYPDLKVLAGNGPLLVPVTVTGQYSLSCS